MKKQATNHVLDQRPVIVLGAGGHAKVLIDMLQRCEIPIIGVTDSAEQKSDSLLGVPIIGDDSVVTDYSAANVLLVNGIGSLPGKTARSRVIDSFRSLGYCFASVVDCKTVIARDVELAEGAQVMAGSTLQPGVVVGRDSIINTHVCVDHDCHIGMDCHLAPGVTLCGGVSVGQGTHIGAGTCVIQSVNIGENVIIGAGSIIIRDIPPQTKFVQPRQELTAIIGE